MTSVCVLMACLGPAFQKHPHSTVQVLSRIPLCEEYYVNAFLVAPARFRQFVHQCRRLPRSTKGNIKLGDRRRNLGDSQLLLNRA